MSTMSDAEIIAWARMLGDTWHQLFGDDSKAAYRFRRLADLAEKGAVLRETVKAWIDADVGEDQEHLDKLVEMVDGRLYLELPAPPGGER